MPPNSIISLIGKIIMSIEIHINMDYLSKLLLLTNNSILVYVPISVIVSIKLKNTNKKLSKKDGNRTKRQQYKARIRMNKQN